LRLALYIKRWLGVTSAPSRVLAISPGDGTSQVLFDDPEGELISAATAAAVHDGEDKAHGNDRAHGITTPHWAAAGRA
jgi:hypothetical protein